MRITVVVVTYNSAGVLPGLLDALPAACGRAAIHELVVADNASSDTTLEVVRRQAPGATVVEMGRNAGYAAGLNAAVDVAAPSDAVLLLNPDTRPRPGAVEHLAAALRRPGVGIAVPRLLHPDGTTAYSLRREPTALRAFGEAVLGGRRAGRVDALGEVIVDAGRYLHEGPVTWATGAAMLMARRCLEVAGRWDESFFLYSEETEFALRARDWGFLVWYTPAAVMEHVGGDAPVSPELWALLTRNRVRLYALRHNRLATVAFRAAVVTGEALRARRGATHRAALRSLLALPHRGGRDGGGVTAGLRLR